MSRVALVDVNPADGLDGDGDRRGRAEIRHPRRRGDLGPPTAARKSCGSVLRVEAAINAAPPRSRSHARTTSVLQF